MFCYRCMREIEDNAQLCPHCGSAVEYKSPLHHLTPGTVLKNRYIVGAALGEGGFGITYIGFDDTLRLRIAIKEYYPIGYANRNNTAAATIIASTAAEKKDFFEQGKEKFQLEARVLAKFNKSPGIVEVRDTFEENNTAYIIMEYLEGINLRDYIKENGGKLDPTKTLELLMPVMSSLKDVHKQNIIHRDISPDNIMITDGKATLLDFGSARTFSNAGNQSLSIMLKHGYAPIEQYTSRGKQGPWTDVYGLCATIYKCVTGIIPDNAVDRQSSDEIKKPSELGIKIDKVYEDTLMKGLSVQYTKRFQSIDELLDGFAGKINTVYERTAVLFDSSDDSRDISGDDELGSADKNKTSPTFSNTVGNEALQYKTELVTDVNTNKNKQTKNLKIIIPIGLVCAAIILAIIFIPQLLNLSEKNISSNTSGEDLSHSSSKPAYSSSEVNSSGSGVIIDEDEFAMPQLVGMTWEEALKEYEDGSLMTLVKEVEYSDEYAEGFIFDQAAKAGNMVKVGSVIAVKVSIGNKPVEIQNFRGLDFETVKKQLEEDGFAVKTSSVENDDVAAGKVVSTEPAAYEFALKGTTVIVYVSMGEKMVTVPDLKGLPIQEALIVCDEYGLTPKVDFEDSSQTKNQIISQSIKPNEKVKPGTNITLMVSTGELPASSSQSSSSSSIKPSSSASSSVPAEPEETTVNILGKEYDIETTTELVLMPVDSIELPQLNDEAMKNVWKLKNLKKLQIGFYALGNSVTSLKGIENLQNLEELKINASRIYDISPLTKLKNLKSLSFDSNLVDIDYTPVSKLTSLTFLQIYGRTMEDLFCLANLTNLTELRLSFYNPQLDPKDIETLRKMMPNCQIYA